ncbi:hypothetical protein GCK32_021783, partial [Trichostrongylus colubriformis]
DPLRLPHVCSPVKRAHDEATRMAYRACQNIKLDPRLASKKPRQLWQEISEMVDNSALD